MSSATRAPMLYATSKGLEAAPWSKSCAMLAEVNENEFSMKAYSEVPEDECPGRLTA